MSAGVPAGRGLSWLRLAACRRGAAATAGRMAAAAGVFRFAAVAAAAGVFRFAAVAAALIVTAAASLAGQETIAADRPGLDFSPFTVAPGTFQVELGLPGAAYTSEDGTSTWLVSFPLLVRVGVAKDLELRAGGSTLNLSRTDTATGERNDSGFGDLEFGLKWRLREAEGAAPAVAFIPSVIVPVGADEFTSDGILLLSNLAAGWSLSDRVGLSAVGGLGLREAGDDAWDVSGLLAVVVASSLTGSLSGFLEGGYLPAEAAADGVLVGGGLTLTPTPDLQLDVFVDRGLSAGSVDWLFGAGVSARWR